MIRLECTTGGSNKFYELHQDERRGRHTVKAYWGAIGQAPKETVVYDGDRKEEATDLYNYRVKQKIAKGYREVRTQDERPGKIWTLPELINDVPIIWAMNAQGVKDDAHFNRLMGDDDYIAQEKLDGMRALVHVTENGLRIFSRSAGVADPTRPLEKTASLPHLAALRFPRLAGSVFDCEILAEGVDCANISGAVHTKDGGRSAKDVKIYVFDMLMERGNDLTALPLYKRLDHLGDALNFFKGVNIVHVPYVNDRRRKDALYKDVLDRGGEGIMLKNLYATYQQGGRPAKNWYKKKKCSTWDCVIMGFTKGEGKYNEQIGAIEFGQYVNGTLKKMGQTSGMIDYDRAHFTAKGSDFIGRAIIVKGMERLKSGAIRHPQWGGWSEKRPEDCVWYEGEQ